MQPVGLNDTPNPWEPNGVAQGVDGDGCDEGASSQVDEGCISSEDGGVRELEN